MAIYCEFSMATCFTRENGFKIFSAKASFSILIIIHIAIDKCKMAPRTSELIERLQRYQFNRLLE